MVFVISGVLMSLIAILYPLTWRSFYENRKNEFKHILDLFYQFNDLCSSRQVWDKFDYKPPDEMKKLFEALKAFNEKLNPFKQMD
ncbi:MAG: hypothetical protein HY753_02650 [Nitrospirae bacterium]|nr:hypothetical protein [Nitrospirota bacterium]